MSCFQQMLTDKIKTIEQLLLNISDSTLPDNYSVVRQVQNGRIYYAYRYYDGDKRRTKYIGSPTCDQSILLLRDRVISNIKEMLLSNKSLLENVIDNYQPILHQTIQSSIQNNMRDIPYKELEKDEEIRLITSSENENVFDSSFLSDDYMKLFEWAKEEYEKNPTPIGDSRNVACDGTIMRSKGECIWYNMLYDEVVPFRYDVVMHFKDEEGYFVIKCPDFLIKCLDGTLIIIEHLGLLNSSDYLKDFMEKVKLYHRNGFVLGVNFFVTADNFNGGTDSQAIKQLVKMIKERIVQ